MLGLALAAPRAGAQPSAGGDLDLRSRRAAELLTGHQHALGFWVTSYTDQARFERPRPELNTFLTSVILDLVTPVAAAAGLDRTLQRARTHLAGQIEEGGLVRYHGRPDGPPIGSVACGITPDADDTALVWRIAPGAQPDLLPRALATIQQYRTPEGLYRTWLAPRDRFQCIDPGKDPNPPDVAIQMHVLLLLSQADPPAARALCGALERAIGDERIWVYYRTAPLIPILRQHDLRQAGCALRLPASRLETAVPGQVVWVTAGPNAAAPPGRERRREWSHPHLGRGPRGAAKAFPRRLLSRASEPATPLSQRSQRLGIEVLLVGRFRLCALAEALFRECCPPLSPPRLGEARTACSRDNHRRQGADCDRSPACCPVFDSTKSWSSKVRPLLGAVFSMGSLTGGRVVDLAIFGAGSFCLLAHVFVLNDWSGMSGDSLDPNRTTGALLTKGIGRTGMLYFCLALLPLCLLLLSPFGPRTLIIALAIAGLSALYSAPAIHMKGVPLLNSALHLIGGLLHFLLGYSVFRTVDGRSLEIGCFFALAFAAGHLSHEARDRDADLLNGIRTNAVRFGGAGAFVAGVSLFTLAEVLLVALAARGVLPRSLVLVSTLCVLRLYWSLRTLRAGLTFENVRWLQVRYRALYAIIGLMMAVTVLV